MDIFDNGPNWKETPPIIRRMIMAILIITCTAIPFLVIFLNISVNYAFAAMYSSYVGLAMIAVGFYFGMRGKQDNLHDMNDESIAGKVIRIIRNQMENNIYNTSNEDRNDNNECRESSTVYREDNDS